jgi:hypothetical protein
MHASAVNLKLLVDLVDSVSECCNVHLLLPPQKYVRGVCLEVGISLPQFL